MFFKPFEALKVNLAGKNLIEASAGTGKTYSIAILVLRLVVEKDISVNKILMVTFTNAAVAELKDRIRHFLKIAYVYSFHNKTNDNNIKSIVDNAKKNSNIIDIQKRLKDAVLLIDELEIMTIHGFCQQTLNEFAFETNRIFGAELVTDVSDIVADNINKFWRKHITTLSSELLQILGYKSLKEEIKQIVKLHLDGKRFLPYDNQKKYTPEDFSYKEFKQQLENNIQHKEYTYQKLITTFLENKESIKIGIERANKSKDKIQLLSLIDKPEKFIDYALKIKNQVLNNTPNTFLEIINDYKENIKSHKELSQTLHVNVCCFAIQEISNAVLGYMSNNNLLNFNSLIDSLHDAVASGDNYKLANELKKKYRAIFIDEFQDTDKSQYKIFETIFLRDYKNVSGNLKERYKFLGYNTIAFLIGDPKQSIYGFRKSDIFTYFKARNFIGNNVYGMQTNYRSNQRFIEAMNHFFQPKEDFDAFCNTDKNNRIEYQIVNAPENSEKEILFTNNKESIPISIFKLKNKNEIYQSVTQTIFYLLTNEDTFIQKSQQQRKVKPVDICVLVRSNAEGLEIKNSLSQKGIPNVFISNSSILNSIEAIEILYLLEAIVHPSKGNINRVCVGNFLKMKTEDLLQLNEELLISRFLTYNEIWLKDGVYPAVMRFANDFYILDNNKENTGNERLKANFIQLAELLNKTEHQKNLSQEELITWLKKNIESNDASVDENQIRIESDEQAVVITTIHKSKGLEFKIVLCPFLDFKINNFNGIVNFRNAAGEYVFHYSNALNDEEKNLYKTQQEQENSRLIYVAITRAIMKCYIFKNDISSKQTTSIANFVNNNNIEKVGLVAFDDVPEVDEDIIYIPEDKEQKTPNLIAHNFSLLQPNWAQWSYSKISGHGEISLKEKANTFDDDYDKFIFETLKFGAATGNFLHLLLEKIDFMKEENFGFLIHKIVVDYFANPSEEFLQNIEKLLLHLIYAPIVTNDQTLLLRNISFSKRLQELEFNFELPPTQLPALLQIANDEIDIYINTQQAMEAEGIFKGFIDLLFEFENKFYILDWKSNYLGFRAEDYTSEKLHRAMNENNYHLQYLIYTVAVKKYLSLRKPEFDFEQHFGGVIYVFLRGVRSDNSNGIYYTLPSAKTIERIEEILGV